MSSTNNAPKIDHPKWGAVRSQLEQNGEIPHFDREIARAIGCGHPTVAKIRAGLEENGTLIHFDPERDRGKTPLRQS